MKTFFILLILLLTYQVTFSQLTSVQIGSSSNVYTVIRNESNMIASNNGLNTLVFIHRNNSGVFGGNSGQFRYDISKDGGSTWTTDLGTLNPTGNTTTLSCRYPQAVIHNPLGNTIADSAYLGYMGAYHNNGDWSGIITGTAKLNNNSTTFLETFTLMNAGDVLIPSGLCNGANGIFWSTDFVYNGTTYGNIIVYKGIYNSTTKNVDWTLDTLLNPLYDLTYDGDPHATTLSMSFDPSGKFGWIAFSGHVSGISDYVYSPVFFNTIDSGKTWQGPTTLNLLYFQNIKTSMGTGVFASLSFEKDMVVDKNGDPHMGVVVCPSGGTDYTIQTTPYKIKMYDFTYNSLTKVWKAILLDSVLTFRGDLTVSASPISADNRPQLSLSPSGDKVFFSWTDSDTAKTGGPNSKPNLIVRGLDVGTHLATSTINFTAGDAVWDGAALFISTASNSLYSGSTHTIPTILTKLSSSQSDLDPAFFYYLKDIQFNNSDFTKTVSVSNYDPPAAPSAGFFSKPVNLCKGSSASFTDQSTGVPTSWQWTFNGGTPGSSSLQNPTITYNTPGTYDVTLIATNALGSDTLVLSSYINIYDIPAANMSNTNVNCYGGKDGAISLSVTGGTSPYLYNWSTGVTTKNLTGLIAGTYSVTVSDANNCSGNNNTSVTQPTPILITSSSVNASCGNADGSGKVSASGGAGSYSYAWSSGQTTNAATNLSAGTYSVKVTDVNACTDSVYILVSNMNAPLVSFVKTNVSCFGKSDGSINITVSGSVSPYSYKWSNAATTEDISNLSGGSYIVEVMGSDSCVAVNNFKIYEPDSVAINLKYTDANCGISDGTALSSAAGGIAPYSYNWSTGGTTNSVIGLAIGNYSITVTDDNGCMETESFTVTNPSAPVATITQVNVKCRDESTGSISVSVSGGTTPYTYEWSNGAETPSINNLTAGTYVITIFDIKQCITIEVIEITQPSSAKLTVTATTMPANVGSNNGSASAVASGGTPPYNYLWNDPAAQTTITAVNLFSGFYTVNVTDALGCKANTTVTVLETGIDDYSLATKILTFPNPNHGIFTVDFNTQNVVSAKISTIDMLGQVIQETYHHNQLNNSKVIIDISSYPQGLYNINIRSQHQVSNKMISVAR